MRFSYHFRVTSTLLNNTLLHSHLCKLDCHSLDAVGCIKQITITTITPAIDPYHLNTTTDTIKMATSAAFALRKKFHPLPFPGAIIISSHFVRKVKYVLIIAIIIYHLQ